MGYMIKKCQFIQATQKVDLSFTVESNGVFSASSAGSAGKNFFEPFQSCGSKIRQASGGTVRETDWG
jgi:hypothetical protein